MVFGPKGKVDAKVLGVFRIADSLVGAHAESRVYCLLMRDNGFYRNYFGTMKVIADGTGVDGLFGNGGWTC